MNKTQKAKIAELRSTGLSYTEIGKVLDIPRETVKSHCRRNGLSVLEEPLDRCRECGKPITQTEGRKKKVFCCKECRVKWWHTHPEMINQKAVYEFICLNCGNSFTAYGNSKRKYCSHSCYIADRFGGGGDE